MNILKKIPEISKEIHKVDVFTVLENKYSIIGPLWVRYQMEWLNDVYTAFKDHEKFLICIYLVKKTLDFYSRNFIKLPLDHFYSKSTIEIEKINIIEISTELNIPKESVRRKIVELEKLGIIKRNNKKITIDRSVGSFVKPINSIKRISHFLSIFSDILEKEKVLSKSLNSKILKKTIEENFSYSWKLYYELQIPMLLGYKNFFGDIETFHIFGTCVVNQHLFSKKNNKNQMNRKEFIKSIYTNTKMQGLNAMSISDITKIPRATVVRKLNQLVKLNYLILDDKKHYKLTGVLVIKLIPLQRVVLERLANFSTKIFNLSIL